MTNDYQQRPLNNGTNVIINKCDNRQHRQSQPKIETSVTKIDIYNHRSEFDSNQYLSLPLKLKATINNIGKQPITIDK